MKAMQKFREDSTPNFGGKRKLQIDIYVKNVCV